MTAGHCVACSLPSWRGITDPGRHEWVPMFPDPTSLYAVLETPEGLAVGLSYHAACAPAIGSDGPVSVSAHGRPLGPSTVVRLDPAPDRYRYWFSARYGQWLRAWTRETVIKFGLADTTYDALLEQWAADHVASSVLASVANG